MRACAWAVLAVTSGPNAAAMVPSAPSVKSVCDCTKEHALYTFLRDAMHTKLYV